MASLIYDLPRLIDLALGTPESGTVNFNVLHALLHSVVQLLNVDDVRVELVGTPICKPDNIPSGSKGQLMTVEEYQIESDGDDSKRTLIERPQREVDKILVVRKWSKDDNVKTRKSAASPRKKALAPKKISDSGQSAVVPDIGSLVDLVQRIESIEEKFEGVERSLANITKKLEISKNETSQSLPANHDQIGAIKEDILSLKNQIKTLTNQRKEDTKDQLPGNPAKSVQKLEEDLGEPIEENLTCAQLGESLNAKIDGLATKFLKLNDHVLDIDKIISTINEQMEVLTQPKKGKAAVITMNDVIEELELTRHRFKIVTTDLTYLTIEREKIRMQLDAATQELEEVSRNKVERDEIDELLAEKADYNMLQRKVSVDDFDANKRDWQNTMVETMKKMQEREEEWCKALENMKKILDLKMNAAEITAVRAYVERNLQAMNRKIDTLCGARKDPEAAGTRIKLLKDLNCISCNQNVMMRTEEDSKVPKTEPMPGHRSIKPFLTYELDNLRKQIKGIGTSRNLHHFESTLKDRGIMTDDKARKICKRYCGGSHTIITPQDRVERGRCKKIHGAKSTTAKCVCAAEPETPPCPCPDDEPKLDQPEDADHCPCPSEDDPYEKCLTAREKRCVEIDSERQKKCKEEMEQKQQKCQDEIEERTRLEGLLDARDKCKTEGEKERRERCMTALRKRDQCRIGMERRTLCKLEQEKYAKCVALNKHDRTKAKEEIKDVEQEVQSNCSVSEAETTQDNIQNEKERDASVGEEEVEDEGSPEQENATANEQPEEHVEEVLSYIPEAVLSYIPELAAAEDTEDNQEAN